MFHRVVKQSNLHSFLTRRRQTSPSRVVCMGRAFFSMTSSNNTAQNESSLLDHNGEKLKVDTNHGLRNASSLSDIVQNVGNSKSFPLLKAVFFISMWAVASSSLIFLNKHLMSEAGFHYPMILCSMGVVASWTISVGLISFGVATISTKKGQTQITPRWYMTHILPIGMFAALSLGFGNYVYLYLSVSFIQMLKACVPAVTLFVMFCAGLERLDAKVLAGVAVLTVGTTLSAYGEIDFKWVGVVMMVTSEFCEAIRMAVLQYLLGNLKFELIEGLYWFSPASLFCLFIGIVWLELPAFMSENGVRKIMESPGLYICAALLGFCVNYLTLGVIKSTSGLTFKVLGQAKNTAVILISVMVFGSQVTSLQILGYTISMAGFYVYQTAKMEQQKAFESASLEMKSSTEE